LALKVKSALQDHKEKQVLSDLKVISALKASMDRKA